VEVAQHDLDDATAVAQVDERDAAVVAPGRHPAGEHDLAALVVAAQRSRAVGPDHVNLFSMCSTTSSTATGSCSPVRKSLTCTTPASRSRSPATTASVAPERSAAFIAPFRPRSPYAMSAEIPLSRKAFTMRSSRSFAAAPSG